MESDIEDAIRLLNHRLHNEPTIEELLDEQKEIERKFEALHNRSLALISQAERMMNKNDA